MKKLLSSVAMSAFLVGCGAHQNSIFRTANGSMFVDAKQRAIISNRAESDDVQARICAEPSPDVFSVLSSAASVGGWFEGDASTDIRAQFAQSLAESGADIGLRTQTIQVLRDMMYRLCERYMSGAITKAEFEQQSARDQRLIVAVLSIEQLTGAVRPSRAVLTSASAADIGREVVELEKLLTEKETEKQKLEGERDNLQGKVTDKDEGLEPLRARVNELSSKENALKEAENDVKRIESEIETHKKANSIAKSCSDTLDPAKEAEKNLKDLCVQLGRVHLSGVRNHREPSLAEAQALATVSAAGSTFRGCPILAIASRGM